jgi:hypothetical protein
VVKRKARREQFFFVCVEKDGVSIDQLSINDSRQQVQTFKSQNISASVLDDAGQRVAAIDYRCDD